MKPLAPNSMIQNRYLVVHLIGKGGMGEVYLAVDQRLGSAVALKRTFFADDEMLGNAFEREAKTLARLRHPVLPKVSDHFAENGEQYLVMEHIAGDDLSKRLESAQKAFPLSWVLFWADQLLDALSYLHSHEPPIIHRDIKPQNLKLTDENHIVLLDFGLSKNSTGQTNISGTASSAATSGSVVGYTPHYAPMEQIRGTGTSPKSDLYALSATLYQLMTNSVPADALSRADSLLNGMQDPIRPLEQINPEVSTEVSRVILKGMEVSQDKRYSSAREMQKALRKAFTAMQEAMSAHTVAFNAQGEIGAANIPVGTPLPSEPFKPAIGIASEYPTQAAGTSKPQTGGMGDSGSGGYDLNSTPTGDSGVRQADVKTEVYRAGDPALTGGATSDYRDFSSTPASPFTEDFRADTGNNSGGGFSPDATVPNISYDAAEEHAPAGSPSHVEFFTTPNVEGGNPFATVTPGSSSAAGEPEHVSHVSQPAPPPAKKKSSKTLLLVGGLAALFILGIGALGAGWFVYANYYAGAIVEPSPTPMPTLEFSPTPEPTVDNSAITNSNENSNSESTLTVEPTPEPTAEPTRPASDDSNPSTPRTIPQNTPRTTSTRPTNSPAAKSTPKPRPNNNRTDIIQ